MTTKPLKLLVGMCLLFMQLLTFSSAFAKGGSMDGGGGDPLGLEFKTSALQALQYLKNKSGNLIEKEDLKTLREVISDARVLVVDQGLDVSIDNFIQSSTAINFRSKNLIVINRFQWNAIKNANMKNALALHEALSLMGIESTGNYKISQNYLLSKNDSMKEYAASVRSVASAVKIQTPCPKPSPDVGKLFSLIKMSGASVNDIQNFLKDHVVSLDSYNEQCETPLLYTVRVQKGDLFEYFYGRLGKPNLDAVLTNKLPDSIYTHALKFGNWEMISQLKKQGAGDLSQTCDAKPGHFHKGCTELMFASTHNSISVIQNLIQLGAQVNQANEQKVTALMIASADNSIDIVKTLIQAGAQVNQANEKKDTALMIASANNSVDIVKTLIQAGARLDLENSDSETALMISSRFKFIDVARVLIEAGAEVDQQAATGWTALMSALTYTGHPMDFVRILIQAGTDVRIRNAIGENALNIFLVHNGDDPADMAIIETLIRAGVDVNNSDKYDNETALMLAAGHGSADVIKMLIRAGADLRATNTSGETALDIAKKVKRSEYILSLLRGN